MGLPCLCVGVQAYSRPKCEASAAPNSALVAKGLKRIRDHFHYADVSTSRPGTS